MWKNWRIMLPEWALVAIRTTVAEVCLSLSRGMLFSYNCVDITCYYWLRFFSIHRQGETSRKYSQHTIEIALSGARALLQHNFFLSVLLPLKIWLERDKHCSLPYFRFKCIHNSGTSGLNQQVIFQHIRMWKRLLHFSILKHITAVTLCYGYFSLLYIKTIALHNYKDRTCIWEMTHRG